MPFRARIYANLPYPAERISAWLFWLILPGFLYKRIMRAHLAFSCLLALDILSAFLLFPFPPGVESGLWAVSWSLAGEGCLLWLYGRKKSAAFVLAAAFSTALPGCFLSGGAAGTFWLFHLLLLLLYFWPLRFIGLGEAALAWIFGPAWFQGYALSGGTAASYAFPWPAEVVECGILAGCSFFAWAFLHNLSRYSRQKSLQHYSLPVIVGTLFPALDRRWDGKGEGASCPDGKRVPFEWAGPALYLLGLAVLLASRSCA